MTLPPEGEIGVLRAAVTRDDMWLIGERPDPRSFPVLWRRSGMANWYRVPADGTLFAAASGGVLLGTGLYPQRDWVAIHLVSD